VPEDDEILEALHAVVDSIGGEIRTGQDAMANLVGATIAGSGHAVIQAGTGTGKSLGYLVPAALHAVAEGGGPVIVATATLALQRQLITRDLPKLVDALEPVIGRPLKFAVLKGRNNYVCLQKLHGYVPEDEDQALFETDRGALGEQAVAVREWAESTTTGDRDEYPAEMDPRVWRAFSVGRRECVGESRCTFGEECFTVLRRLEAQEADIVVTNHAILAIEAVEGISVLPEHDAVIIDEAHELVDRITSASAAELSASMFDRALSRSRGMLDDATHDRLTAAAEALSDALESLSVDQVKEQRILELPKSVVLALTLARDATHSSIAAIGSESGASPEDLAARAMARGALEEIHDVVGTFLGSGRHDVVWLEAGERRGAVLRLAPLSVASTLEKSLFSQTPVVLTSATLTVNGGFNALIEAVGVPPSRVTSVDVGSPFDYAKQGILYVASDIPPPDRDGVAMEALDELADLIVAAGGRTLALFSSWRGVERAADYLRVRLESRTDLPILVQRRGDSVSPLVERFAEDPRSTLLGTVSLWQGVDVPGESCVCVVIDRIPFPRPDDPLMSARSAVVDEAGGSGFASVSVPRAGLLLAQGAGRLIRSGTDRGVVAVLDSRLATARYSSALRKSMPPLWFTTDRSTVIGALTRLNDEFNRTDFD
jgi:ATP-dependent DNA helicase DinG